MDSNSNRYRIVPHRPPRRADATLFRSYWRRQRSFHRPSREFMRDLAHDYWLARHADGSRLEVGDRELHPAEISNL